LADAFIGDDGCDLVAQFLRDNPSTTSVELRGNNIGPEGASYISQALVGASSIRSLSLEWNSVGDGLGPLSEALTINSKLEMLDLRNNRIGPLGASLLARMLSSNKSIYKIDLRWNEIGSAGAQEIFQAL
jgi:Ran GTPase-activating protein (RanGAP) involved in mRNA processing and transport